MKEHTRGWRFLQLVVCLLLAKTLLATVYEYRRYTPPDFESLFLSGRENTFWGVYAIAFYVHIVSGPIAISAAAILHFSGRRQRIPAVHRHLGKMLVALVLLGVVPSGIVMAGYSFGGPIAESAFLSHAAAVTFCAILTARSAQTGQLEQHGRWADRTLLLLVAPLVLRIVGGVLQTANVDSPVAYQLNSWLSWMVPLAIHELCYHELRGRAVGEQT